MYSSQGSQFINDRGWYEGEYKDEKYHMVMEQKLGLMETNMKGNSRMGKEIVKECSLYLMEISM